MDVKNTLDFLKLQSELLLKSTVTDWVLIPTLMILIEDCFIENVYAMIAYIKIYSLNTSLAFQSSRKAKRKSRQELAINMIMDRSKYSTRQTKASRKQKQQLCFIAEAKPSKS